VVLAIVRLSPGRHDNVTLVCPTSLMSGCVGVSGSEAQHTGARARARQSAAIFYQNYNCFDGNAAKYCELAGLQLRN